MKLGSHLRVLDHCSRSLHQAYLAASKVLKKYHTAYVTWFQATMRRLDSQEVLTERCRHSRLANTLPLLGCLQHHTPVLFPFPTWRPSPWPHSLPTPSRKSSQTLHPDPPSHPRTPGSLPPPNICHRPRSPAQQYSPDTADIV